MIIDPEFDELEVGSTLAELLRRPQEMTEEQLIRERIAHSSSPAKKAAAVRARAKKRALKLDFTRREAEPCRR